MVAAGELCCLSDNYGLVLQSLNYFTGYLIVTMNFFTNRYDVQPFVKDQFDQEEKSWIHWWELQEKSNLREEILSGPL